MPLETQQRFQQLLFPEGIPYDRAKSYGTAIVGPIFKLKQEFELDESKNVRALGFIWNQIVADLKRMAQC